MVPSLHINITEEIDVNDRHNVDSVNSFIPMYTGVRDIMLLR